MAVVANENGRINRIREAGSNIDQVYLKIWMILGLDNAEARLQKKNEIALDRAAYKKILAELAETTKEQAGLQLLNDLNQALQDAREVNNHTVDLGMSGNQKTGVPCRRGTNSCALE